MTPLPDLLAKLQAHLESLGDGRDCKSLNEQAAYRADYDGTQRIISVLQNAPNDVARWERCLAEVQPQIDEWRAKETELIDQIAAFTDWRLAGDARQRDAEYARQRDVRRRLERLREGSLYRSPDVTYPPIEHIEQEIARLTKRRDQARERLALAITQAEALLGATVSA